MCSTQTFLHELTLSRLNFKTYSYTIFSFKKLTFLVCLRTIIVRTAIANHLDLFNNFINDSKSIILCILVRQRILMKINSIYVIS